VYSVAFESQLGRSWFPTVRMESRCVPLPVRWKSTGIIVYPTFFGRVPRYNNRNGDIVLLSRLPSVREHLFVVALLAQKKKKFQKLFGADVTSVVSCCVMSHDVNFACSKKKKVPKTFWGRRHFCRVIGRSVTSLLSRHLSIDDVTSVASFVDR